MGEPILSRSQGQPVLVKVDQNLFIMNKCFTYFKQFKQFIPNILLLPKKRQFDILAYGYKPDNDELC